MQCILSVDLRNASSDQRKTFNAEMAKRKWIKITSLTTVWSATWKSDVAEVSIISGTQTDVLAAANAAQITAYDAAVAVCENAPTVWSKS